MITGVFVPSLSLTKLNTVKPIRSKPEHRCIRYFAMMNWTSSGKPDFMQWSVPEHIA